MTYHSPARSNPLDERKEAKKLCPKAEAIKATIERRTSVGTANKHLDLRKIMKDLEEELLGIDEEVERIRKGRWPISVCTDEDSDTWQRAVRRARLGVQETCLLVLSTCFDEMGYPVGVLADLMKSISSAQISSGDHWKRLEPTRPVRGKHNPTDLDARARLAAIAMLHSSAAERQEVYKQAEAAGWDKKAARNLVLNSDNGKLTDQAFLELRSYWYERFQNDLADAQKSRRQIPISSFFRSPYSP